MVIEQALAFINNTGRSIFLSGKAGTGKTSFLRGLVQQVSKRMVITAPTGIAAIHAGGVTIHSLFNLPPQPFIPGQDAGSGKMDKAKRDLLYQMELLVIDEVSMVRADMIDALDCVLRTVRKKPELPFGGVQVLFIGDPYQLSPIATDADWAVLKGYYRSPFFAEAKVFQNSMPVFLELEKVYRQRDPFFIELLNAVRTGHCGLSEIERLNLCVKPTANAMVLTTHNAQVEAINSRYLEGLDGEPVHFAAEISGEFEESAFPAEKNLRLKTGARIMVLRNDKEGRYYNGKMGVIMAIEADGLVVRFDDGLCVTISKETWANIRYEYDPVSGGIRQKEMGSFRQYPIRLARAMTIHKSQGMSFEAAEVDLSGMFAPGQAYVALSRLRSLEGLTLKAPLSAENLNANAVSPNVPAAWSTPMDIAEILEREEILFFQERIPRLFDLTDLTNFLAEYKNLPGTEALFAETRRHLEVYAGVAQKFQREVAGLFESKRAAKFDKIAERVTAATAWFTDQLDSQLIPLATEHRQKSTGNVILRKNLLLANGLLTRYGKKKKELAMARQLAAEKSSSHNVLITST